MNINLEVEQTLEKLFNCVSLTAKDVEDIIYLLSETAIPEFKDLISCKQNSKYHKYNLLGHTIDVFMRVREKAQHDIILMWAALLHDVGKPYVETVDMDGYNHYYEHPKVSAELTDKILARLGYSSKFIESVKELVSKHDEHLDSFKKLTKLRRFIADMSPEQLDRWIILKEADLLSHKNLEHSIERLKDLINKMEQIKQDGSAITINELKITPSELIELGIEEKYASDILERLRNDCLGVPLLNNHDWLIKNSRQYYKKLKHKLQEIKA